MTWISAVSQEGLIANQVVQGKVDAVVFENFIYWMLQGIFANDENRDRDIVIMMDNAAIHKDPIVFETCRAFKVIVVFNA